MLPSRVIDPHDQQWMNHALAIAIRSGETSPNPMVGAVLVDRTGALIGEGWHVQPGSPHAEVNAINAVTDPQLLKGATLYVTLEPCNHVGRTPPCTLRIIEAGISRVVVCCRDPNPLVSGCGIAALQEAGITVDLGVEEGKGRWINRRFITVHETGRPYIILKWAQTADGFIAHTDGSSRWISGQSARTLVHRWRSEEDAILVGTNTAIIDNPALTVRHTPGRNPLRVILDRAGRIPLTQRVFDQSAPTLVVGPPRIGLTHELFVSVGSHPDPLQAALHELQRRSVLSVIIEGGQQILNYCLHHDLWDEARVFVSPHRFGEGISAPQLPSNPIAFRACQGEDTLLTSYNPRAVCQPPPVEGEPLALE